MTRQAILAVVIGIIIVLGVAAAFLYSRINQTPDESSTVATQETETQNGMMAGSVVDIFTKGENARCTFTSSDENGDVSGTFYVSGENARGDIDTSLNGETQSMHMIRNGDTFYMWGDSLPTGIKMVMSVDEWAQSAQEAQPTNAPKTFDPNKSVDFNCAAWTVDSGLFSAPTEVEFVSFEGMFGPTGAMTDDSVTPGASNESSTPDQCSICNALTGDAKNVCLQQFNCQ